MFISKIARNYSLLSTELSCNKTVLVHQFCGNLIKVIKVRSDREEIVFALKGGNNERMYNCSYYCLRITLPCLVYAPICISTYLVRVDWVSLATIE